MYLSDIHWTLVSWPGIDNTIFATTTHLANQDYDICFRREENYCRTCFSPKFATSFGIGIAAAAAGESGAGVDCDGSTAGKTDYIEIAGAQTGSTNTEFATKDAAIGWDRMCGVTFNNLGTAATTAATVCSKYCLFCVKPEFHFNLF